MEDRNARYAAFSKANINDEDFSFKTVEGAIAYVYLMRELFAIPYDDAISEASRPVMLADMLKVQAVYTDSKGRINVRPLEIVKGFRSYKIREIIK